MRSGPCGAMAWGDACSHHCTPVKGQYAACPQPVSRRLPAAATQDLATSLPTILTKPCPQDCPAHGTSHNGPVLMEPPETPASQDWLRPDPQQHGDRTCCLTGFPTLIGSHHKCPRQCPLLPSSPKGRLEGPLLRLGTATAPPLSRGTLGLALSV